MFYELRMYHTAPGRLGDVAARMRDLVPAVFRKHSFPAPLAEWRATAGSKMPLFVWMITWPDSETRSRTFASLYGDKEWMDIRAQTNGPREMVLQYDISFMADTAAGSAARKLHADRKGEARGLHELRVHYVYPGRLAQANDVLARVDLPALKRAGATTLGVFEIQSGLTTPGFAHFIAWDNFEARSSGLDAYEADETVRSARAAEAGELKTHLLGRYDSWLLEPYSHGTPHYGFAPRS